jgi:hypothetical protein
MTAQHPLENPRSLNPSTTSSARLESAEKELASDHELTASSRLLPASICWELVANIDGDGTPIGGERAAFWVRKLLAGYPNLKPHDAQGYTLIVTEILAAFPEGICRRVIDPVRGIATAFPPSRGELRQALDAEVARRKLVRASALWHIEERQRRERAAAEERAFDARRGTEAERAALVRSLLRPRAMPDPELPGPPTPPEYMTFSPESGRSDHVDISDFPDREAPS